MASVITLAHFKAFKPWHDKTSTVARDRGWRVKKVICLLFLLTVKKKSLSFFTANHSVLNCFRHDYLNCSLKKQNKSKHVLNSIMIMMCAKYCYRMLSVLVWHNNHQNIYPGTLFLETKFKPDHTFFRRAWIF